MCTERYTEHSIPVWIPSFNFGSNNYNYNHRTRSPFLLNLWIVPSGKIFSSLIRKYRYQTSSHLSTWKNVLYCLIWKCDLLSSINEVLFHLPIREVKHLKTVGKRSVSCLGFCIEVDNTIIWVGLKISSKGDNCTCFMSPFVNRTTELPSGSSSFIVPFLNVITFFPSISGTCKTLDQNM